MLNGDAHHSMRADGELRIGRCRVLKDQNGQRITNQAQVVTVFIVNPCLTCPDQVIFGRRRRPGCCTLAMIAT